VVVVERSRLACQRSQSEQQHDSPSSAGHEVPRQTLRRQCAAVSLELSASLESHRESPDPADAEFTGRSAIVVTPAKAMLCPSRAPVACRPPIIAAQCFTARPLRRRGPVAAQHLTWRPGGRARTVTNALVTQAQPRLRLLLEAQGRSND
jgi:hypothetical protein